MSGKKRPTQIDNLRVLFLLCATALTAIESGAHTKNNTEKDTDIKVWIKRHKKPARISYSITTIHREKIRKIFLSAYINRILGDKKKMFRRCKIQYDQKMNRIEKNRYILAYASPRKNTITIGENFFNQKKGCQLGVLLHELGHLHYSFVQHLTDAIIPFFFIMTATFLQLSLILLPYIYGTINTPLFGLLTLFSTCATCLAMTELLFKNFFIRREEAAADRYAVRHLTTKKSAEQYITLKRDQSCAYKNWFDEFLYSTRPSGERYAHHLTSLCPALQAPLNNAGEK